MCLPYVKSLTCTSCAILAATEGSLHRFVGPGGSFCHLWKIDRPPLSEGFLFEGFAHFLTKEAKRHSCQGTRVRVDLPGIRKENTHFGGPVLTLLCVFVWFLSSRDRDTMHAPPGISDASINYVRNKKDTRPDQQIGQALFLLVQVAIYH